MSLSGKTWKSVSLGSVVLFASAVLSACGGGSTASSNNDINWYIPTEIITLDNSKMVDNYSVIAVGNSGSNLLRQGENGEMRLDLADSIGISEDGLTYTATLREGLKWSDGSELTAEDFVYTWQRIVTPATASEYAKVVLEANVLNADEVLSGKKEVDELGVRADGNKVIFTLSEPSPQFMSLLSFSNFVPQNERFVKKAGDKYGTSSEYALYSGPYMIENWDGVSGDFTLVKNENYWDADNVKTAKVTVQTVKKPETAVQMYKKGELDTAIISTSEAIYKANKNRDDIVVIPEAITTFLMYNQTGSTESLTNTKIRQALNLATNREGLVEAAIDTGSKAARSLVPSGFQTLEDETDLADYVAPGYTYDEEEAVRLFQEGLAELGVDSLSLTITADSDNPVAKASVDYLQQSWEELLPGLTIEGNFLTFKQRIESTKNNNFDIALALWGGAYPEASAFYGLFTTDSDYNHGRISDIEYDLAYQKAIASDNSAEHYKAAEKILFDNAFYNPIYFRSSEALQNPNITGLVRNSTGISVDFTYAYKE